MATHRKLLRKFGGTTADGRVIPAGEVEPAKAKNYPMKFMGTTLLVRAVAGQSINPQKEYMRQMGINRKRLKKMRAKAKKREVNLSDVQNKK